MRWFVIIPLCLTGCGLVPEGVDSTAEKPAINDTGVDPTLVEAQEPGVVVDDQTTRIAATGPLGRTVASLGDASQPGLWLKTPLVAAEGRGRVTYPATGRSTAVTLIPIDGPATAGSRLSLQAMQALGASLTDLPEIEVRAGG